jgi:hypothetical protein
MRFLAVLALLVVLGLSVSSAPPPVPTATVVTVPIAAPRADLAAALAVLHAWDGRRAQAWASGDPRALRSLYVRGSEAGRADAGLLAAYTARGIVVRRMVTQVFAARVLRQSPGSYRLRVFDRVAGGELVREGKVGRLPSSRPVTRVLELRRRPEGWRVVSVSDSGRGPRGARR